MADDLIFEWDEPKRRQTIAKHGVDPVRAALIFEGDVLVREDTRRDYGERRFVALGAIDDEVFVVVHTRRGERIRLITAWKGGRDEEAVYFGRFPRRDP